MDGNGRWARKQGLERILGHRKGTNATVSLVDRCLELGVEYLTLYVFSSENWDRPAGEVHFLIEELLVQMMHQELSHLQEKEVRLQILGDLNQLPEQPRSVLEDGMQKTAGNSRMQLNLAISYGGRQELTHAMQKIAAKVAAGELAPESIREETLAQHLYQPEVPDPELMIRTGGEQRISNYLLWQLAYSEFYFTDVLWPDFDAAELDKALQFFGQRQRRFGKVLDE
jgi:undecaprenyl diphosphate synthase